MGTPTEKPNSEQAMASATAERRDCSRQSYRVRGQLICDLEYGTNARPRLVVEGLDLSTGGLCFTHRSYVHLGTRCSCVMIGPSRDGMKVSGTVVRFEYTDKRRYEIGIAFDEAIDLAANGIDRMLEVTQDDSPCGGQ